jgi:SAM-dependent methyltransferase|tara:strand:- start:1315 stop:2067 length:753 start_codon:yes stop_codon:yes gene_type:complete
VQLTEAWGMPMPRVQLEMVYRRYQFLAELVGSGRLLEVGCGAALGNEILTREAAVVVSFDLDLENLCSARGHVGGLLGCSDAEALPFAGGSFDVVAACEMIYYVQDQKQLVSEARRVLRPGGRLFVAVANPERPGFHHSPMSTHYPTAGDLSEMLMEQGFIPELYGVFPLGRSMRARLFRLLASVASKLQLVPGTLAGRGMVKRLFVGGLSPFGGFEGIDDSDVAQPVPIDPSQKDRFHHVLYAVGRLEG